MNISSNSGVTNSGDQQPDEAPVIPDCPDVVPRANRSTEPISAASSARSSRRCQWTLFAIGLLLGLKLNSEAEIGQVSAFFLAGIGFIVGRIIDTRRFRYFLFFPVILLLVLVLNLLATTLPSTWPDDKSAVRHVNQGVDALKIEDYDLAITYFSQVIKLNPSDSKAYANRSLVYTKTGQYELAIADSNMALSLNTNCAEAYYSRGLSFRETGQLDKADADIEKAFQINPDLGKK